MRFRIKLTIAVLGTRGDCAGSQEVAVFGLGLSRDISTDKR